MPDSTLAAVGLPASVAVPTRFTPTIATAITNQVVSYVGAEYCPYCAIQALGAGRGALSVRHVLQPERSGALLIVKGLSEPRELKLHRSPLAQAPTSPSIRPSSPPRCRTGAGSTNLGEDGCRAGGRLRPLRPAGGPALCRPGRPVRHDRRERISLVPKASPWARSAPP